MEVAAFTEFPVVLLATWIVMFRCFGPKAEGGVEFVAAGGAATVLRRGAGLPDMPAVTSD